MTLHQTLSPEIFPEMHPWLLVMPTIKTSANAPMSPSVPSYPAYTVF